MVWVFFSYSVCLNRRKTLELRPGIALVLQDKIAVAELVPIPEQPRVQLPLHSWEQARRPAVLFREHQELLVHLNPCWLYHPSCHFPYLGSDVGALLGAKSLPLGEGRNWGRDGGSQVLIA